MAQTSAVYEQDTSFETHGLCLVRNVLSGEEVREYRDLFRRVFAENGRNNWRMRDAARGLSTP
jgi:ectoine hydroxylase-related dioxygenase (phytanoyl-CoA dioxygenase family)